MLVAILKASLQHAAAEPGAKFSLLHSLLSHRRPGDRNPPAMMAFVEAIAGMMRFTTPCVNCHVTPEILKLSARVRAVSYSQ